MTEVNLIFKHHNKKYPYKCNLDDNIGDVCEKIKEKIKLNRIFFIYDGNKINLELNMRVGEQLQIEDTKKKKRKYEISVYDEPIQIKIGYSGKNTIIRMKENEKMEDVLKKFAASKQRNLDEFYFLYDGEVMTEEKYSSSFDDLAKKIDKDASTMSIAANDVNIERNNSIVINENDRDIGIDGDNPLIIKPEKNININIDPQVRERRKLLLKVLTILLIQYLSVVSVISLIYFVKLKNLFSTDKYKMMAEVIPVLFVVIVMSVVSNEVLKNFKDNKYLLIYDAFSAVFTIYFTLLLSKFFDFELDVVIISLSLIIIEILAMEVYLLLFKNFKNVFLALSRSLLSLIGVVLLSVFWKKPFYPNKLSILLFWIFSLAYISIHFFFIMKFCNLGEHFYASIIFNYGLFLLIALGLKYIYDIIRAQYIMLEENLKLQLKTYCFLIIQTLIIIVFDGIGFYYNWESIVGKFGSETYKWIFSLTLIINFFMCLFVFILLVNDYTIDNDKKWNIYHILYILFMISISFMIRVIPVHPNYILGILVILLFNMLAVALYIFFSNSINISGSIIIPVLMNILTLIMVHFFWLKDNKAILPNLIIPFIFVLLWTFLSYAFKKDDLEPGDYNHSLLLFDYSIFIIIYTIAIILTGLALLLSIGLVILAFYLLGIILQCLCGSE